MLTALLALGIPLSQTSPAQVLDHALVFPLRGGNFGQVHVDPVEAVLVQGREVEAADGTSLGGKKWTPAQAGSDGSFSGPAFEGGYAAFDVSSASDRVVLLEAMGPSFVYVNGEPRVGDVYSSGYVSLPIRLRAGHNQLLFRCARGGLKVTLVDPPKPVSFDLRDPTKPDRIAGDRSDLEAAVIVRNATDRPLNDLRIESASPGGRRRTTAVASIPPMTVRKVGFLIGPGAAGDVTLRLLEGGRELDHAKLPLRLRKPNETQNRTFVSGIDGSVQYYGVNPAQSATHPALVLSLHGASVEGSGQAEAYSSKPWATIVAPTNRRPYGYDWEDWGRLDALEVLDVATKWVQPDPSRVYLVGHSMGGHGTWQLGVLYPDKFAAIGPSAGWISAFSYGGGRRVASPNPIEDILQRSGSQEDTAALAPNTVTEGIYIIHGGADDNVPVTEAQEMARILSGFHHDYVLHIQPGQNHWWDISDEPGADCVDWAPLFDFLARHARPPKESVRQVDFLTPNPEVSPTCHWVTVEGQEHEMKLSEVHLRCDPYKRRFVGTTANVSRMSLGQEVLEPGKGIELDIDDQKVEIPTAPAGPIHLAKVDGKWTVGELAPPAFKNPRRYGPYRLAFNHRMIFVVGTGGTPEENAWAAAKARYDAETFWYRGNGSVDVVPDRDFDPNKDVDRSVILYGNADTNRAWPALLAGSPVTVTRGHVRIGGRDLAGDDLTCLFLRPRPHSDVASVAVVSGSGLPGMRLSNTLPYLQPMIGFPDVFVAGADSLEKGLAGVRAAGFFGEDWSVEKGDFAFREGNP